MNQLTIIGNLTRDPELRVTSDGTSVCSFTVAVNRKKASREGQPEADYFSVSAWRQLGENCSRYLAKGKKVCVVGPVSLRTFRGRDGTEKSILEVTANDVEFLSPRTDDAAVPAPQAREDAPARAPQQMSLTHPGNIDRQEQAYLSAEREAIRNEKNYVVVNDSEELPF